MAWLYTWNNQTPGELLLVIRCMPSQKAVLGWRCLYPSTPLFTLGVGGASGLKQEHLSGWCESVLCLWTQDLGFKRAGIALNTTQESKITFSCLFSSQRNCWICVNRSGAGGWSKTTHLKMWLSQSHFVISTVHYLSIKQASLLRDIALWVASLESECTRVQN